MLEELKKKNKRKSVLLLLTIILGLGISLASIYFMYTYRDSRENQLATGLIKMNFVDDEYLNLNLTPVIDDIGIENTPYEFSIQNTSTNVPINVDIKLGDVNANVEENTNLIDLGAIRYALYIEDELVKKDYVHKEDLTLYTYENLGIGDTINCKLVLWIDYYYDNPGGIFSAKVEAVGISRDIIENN